MNRSIRKKIGQFLIILTILSILQFFAPIKKALANDTNSCGSFTLTLQEVTKDGSLKNLPHIRLQLYQVGTAQNNGTFALIDELADTGVDFRQLNTAGKVADAAKRLSDAVSHSTLFPQEQTTDANGMAQFCDLPHGMYLILHIDTANPVEMSPMLLSIPYTDENGKQIYDIHAYPKTNEPDPTRPPKPTITPQPTDIPEPTVTPQPTASPNTPNTPDDSITPGPGDYDSANSNRPPDTIGNHPASNVQTGDSTPITLLVLLLLTVGLIIILIIYKKFLSNKK